ncbi:hypothetical protein WJX81_006058 [Elliptochloris bilobata]|uniref:UBC core domain-containing protein n=1 Tax=Elliptochloris bilobata TaxID=381761 RepID=A0AAW1RU10_9CHLO
MPRTPKRVIYRDKLGSRRLQAEFQHLSRQMLLGALPQVSELEMVGDNVFRWRFCLSDFDGSTPGGRDLNADLAILQRRHGRRKILMEVIFPDTYPRRPFALRIVRPRMAWYTGHVTAGGTVCLEALSQSGSRGAWQQSYDVEAILQQVISNMTTCERVRIRTPTGPGGMSGPLRLDLDGKWSGLSPMAEYSEAEARAALGRTEATHLRIGW